jgi:hypothetical protein
MKISFEGFKLAILIIDLSLRTRTLRCTVSSLNKESKSFIVSAVCRSIFRHIACFCVATHISPLLIHSQPVPLTTGGFSDTERSLSVRVVHENVFAAMRALLLAVKDLSLALEVGKVCCLRMFSERRFFLHFEQGTFLFVLDTDVLFTLERTLERKVFFFLSSFFFSLLCFPAILTK